MLLRLKVKPNQRFNRIEKQGEEFVVRIKAPAEDGKANAQLVSYLSDILDLPKSAIHIKKGITSKIKLLEISATENFVLEKLGA